MTKKNVGGRPPLFAKAMRPIHLTLPEKSVGIAKRLGNQNVSDGIRIALDMADSNVRYKQKS